MLYLYELRNICRRKDINDQSFRSLLLAAAVYDKKAFGRIFYLCGFSLSKFEDIIKGCKEINVDEDRLVIEVIKRYNEPTDLHLVKILCEIEVPLSIELKKLGLDMFGLKNEINKMLSPDKKVFEKNEFLDDPLTNFLNIHLN